MFGTIEEVSFPCIKRPRYCHLEQTPVPKVLRRDSSDTAVSTLHSYPSTRKIGERVRSETPKRLVRSQSLPKTGGKVVDVTEVRYRAMDRRDTSVKSWPDEHESWDHTQDVLNPRQGVVAVPLYTNRRQTEHTEELGRYSGSFVTNRTGGE